MTAHGHCGAIQSDLGLTLCPRTGRTGAGGGRAGAPRVLPDWHELEAPLHWHDVHGRHHARCSCSARKLPAFPPRLDMSALLVPSVAVQWSQECAQIAHRGLRLEVLRLIGECIQ